MTDRNDSSSNLLDLLDGHIEAGDIGACISTCRAILDRLDPTETPDAYGVFEAQLANFIAKDTSNPDRFEDAIVHHESALRHLSDDNGSDIAASNGSLGNLFMDRGDGDRTENVSAAIEHYERALAYFEQHDRNSANWTATHQSLVDAFMELGGHESDVIAHADAALTTLEPGSARWTRTNLALSEVYSHMADTDRAIPYLERALSGYPQDHHREYGHLQERLGHWFAASRTCTTEAAFARMIGAFTAALNAYEAGGIRDGVNRAHAQIGSRLATSTFGSRSDNVRSAMAHLEAVVAQTQPGDPEWEIVNEALGRLRRSEHVELGEHEESAIDNLTAALSSGGLAPEVRASLHTQLGLAYAERRAGFRDDNLERAIANLTTALDVEADPANRARIHHNLSLVFRRRLRGVDDENLRESLAHVHAALEHRSAASTPLDWSDSMRSLGEVRVAIARTEPAPAAGRAQLRAAVACFEESSSVLDMTSEPRRWAEVNLSIAGLLAIAPNPSDDDRARALECCAAAQQVFTRDEDPVRWAQCERFRQMLGGDDALSVKLSERLADELRGRIPDADDPFARFPDQIIDFIADPDNRPAFESSDEAMTGVIELVAEKLRGLLVTKDPELVGDGLLTIHLVPDWDLRAQSFSEPPYHVAISENLVRFCMNTSELLALGLGFQAVGDDGEPEGSPVSPVLSPGEVAARFANLLAAYRDKRLMGTVDVDRGPAHLVHSQVIFFTTLAFLLSHEISHVVLAQHRRRSEPPPFGDYVDAMLSSAFESIVSGRHHPFLDGGLDHFAGPDLQAVYDNWREEINADVIAASLTAEYQHDVGPWSHVPDVLAQTNLGIHLALVSQMILTVYRNRVWSEDVVLTPTHPPMDFRTFCVLKWIHRDTVEVAERPIGDYATEILDELLRLA